MPVKKKVTSNKKQVTRKRSTRVSRSGGLSVPVYSLAGRLPVTLSLPKEIFGSYVNEKLLAQAIRVYLTNQKNLSGSTKTRGEVKGSTAKIWKQKGTGRARHGARTAPIFVGGGVSFGPKPRKITLDLPKKMKKAALISALSAKMYGKEILGLQGLEKASGKTKEIADFLVKIREKGKEKSGKYESALIVTVGKVDNVVRAVRNIPGISAMPVSQLNAYDIVRHQYLILTKEAIASLNQKKKG